ncbi:MAG: hypothetical protein R3F29_04250 [Planctomycetota bacterium]
MEIQVILFGVVTSIVAALLLIGLLGARWLPLAVAFGVFGAHWLLKKTPPPLPHELWSNGNGVAWTMWGVVAAALVALLERLRVLPQRLGQIGGAAVAVFAVYLVLEKVASRWSQLDVWLYVGGGGVLAIATVLALRTVLTRAPQPTDARWSWVAVLFLVLLSLDAGLVVEGGKTAFAAQLCGAVAAALGAGVGLGVLFRSRAVTLAPADAAWLGTAHVLFLTGAVHLNQLPWLSAAPALAAPLALLALPKELGKRQPWRWFAVAAAIVVLLHGTAMMLLPAADPSGY